MNIANKLLLEKVTTNPDWPKLRRKWLKWHDECAACGEKNKRKLVVHHKVPVHIDQKLEVDLNNLITLCKNCHHLFGHLKDWMSYNENVREDAETWHDRIKNRPKWRR